MVTPARTRALHSLMLGAAAVALLGGAAGSLTADSAAQTLLSSGSYEARLTGSSTATLRGVVDQGQAPGPSPRAAFAITLGAYSNDGALLFSRWDGGQPAPGTYPITDAPTEGGVTALVVTGSPNRPTGAFRAERGSLTITHSSPAGLIGRFELEARGYSAADPDREDRELTARGAFTTLPGQLRVAAE
jgi:hypothetical protein